ncbi:hypothetical protein SUGI_0802610 [Cryptomeria japonica]|nr:hypothetical protein SUGI_0802610 [Cryptomeria japonica]
MSCQDLDTGVESNSTPISPANLWILFVLTASTYALTALIHIGRKLHQSRQDWRVAHTVDFSRHVMTIIKSLQIRRLPASIEIQR